MPVVAGLAAMVALPTLLVILVLVLRRRSSARRATDASDLSVDGQAAPDAIEPGTADSLTVRVLRAQVRALEQALEELEAEARVAPVQEAPDQQPAQAPGVTDIVETTGDVAHAPADGDGSDRALSGQLLPVLEEPPTPPDLVLPVPQLTVPEVRPSARWFRRRAA